MAERKQLLFEIENLAFDGKAVAHLDGKVVFLDGGLPGETVRAEIVRSKPRHIQAKVVEIVSPGPDRVRPRCEHDPYCGGCAWQDLRYEKQLACKREQVIACLEHIGRLTDVETADIVRSSEQFYYRNKMEFSFHVTPEDHFTLGLHRRGRFDEIFDVDHCYLQSETSNAIVAWVRRFVVEKNIPVYDVLAHTGFMRFLVIREGKRTGQTLINLVTNFGEMPAREELVTGLTEAFPEITTIVQNQTDKKSNIAIGEREEVLYGPGFIEEEVCSMRFRIMANSFFQTNSAQAEKLYEIGFDQLELSGSERLLDLYCGTGAIGLVAADRVAEVVGVELVADAIKVARQNAEINGVTNISFLEGNVNDLLKTEVPTSGRFDCVVIDPPRAGLHPKAIRRMLRLKPPRLLYISCNPATFARDAQMIVDDGYELPRVIPVDMFPHTKHIELVARFNRTKQ